MKNTYLEYLGGQIRKFRKARGMSLEELSGIIRKSKSSLYLYETGQTAIDVVTLNQIAQALHVMPFQLLNAPAASQTDSTAPRLSERFYLYHCYRDSYCTCLIECAEEPGTDRSSAVMYYYATDFDHLEECDAVYEGYMQQHPRMLTFLLHNSYNAAETVLINCMIPILNVPVMNGILSGLHEDTLMPIAFRIILSTLPLQPQEIRDRLTMPAERHPDLEENGVLFASML